MLASFLNLFDPLDEHLFNMVWRSHVLEVIEVPVEVIRW